MGGKNPNFHLRICGKNENSQPKSEFLDFFLSPSLFPGCLFQSVRGGNFQKGSIQNGSAAGKAQGKGFGEWGWEEGFGILGFAGILCFPGILGFSFSGILDFCVFLGL